MQLSAQRSQSIFAQNKRTFRLLPLRTRSIRSKLQCRNSSSDAENIMAKYGLSPTSGSSNKQPAFRQPGPVAAAAAQIARPAGNGVFILLLLNVVVFCLDHILHIKGIQNLYLNHAKPQWFQWITHAFCHANWSHLSMNLFNLCVFGKMVEETEGAAGLIAAYLITAVGAALASVYTQPAFYKGAVSVSLGASGAIFGLFAVSVLTRMSWDPRRLLEGAVLGQFVVGQVLQEARAQAAGGAVIAGLKVGHVAHLAGALAGVLLVWLLSKIPDPDQPRK